MSALDVGERPRISRSGGRVRLSCARGHDLASIDRRDWAGSLVEAMAGRPVRCRECIAAAAVRPVRRADADGIYDETVLAIREVNGPERAPERDVTDRDTAIAAIRTALRRRTGRAWSVSGGRGTSWGWIRVTAPPARRVDGGSYMTDEDRAVLAEALGLDTVHPQGESIPAGYDYRREYVDRAEGRPPSVTGRPYWD